MLDYENQSISPDFIPYNPLPSISPDGSDLQKIDSRNIQFIEKMKVSNLEFIPVDSDKIVATINASTEGISIDANKISISGSTSFSSGYDPSQKVDEIGGNYTSSTSGARVLIFPDTITGIQVKDDASNDVFKCLVGGTNVGDVILGDYNSGKYVMWDKSETTLKLGSNAYVDSRLASTISSAINASGNFVNNVINTNLDTSTKQILGSFTFGTSGAIKMATDDNNGLWLSPNGIFGKKSGATTFSIDTQGNATFAGNLNAASGTLGAITIGSNAWHVDSSGNMWWGNYTTYADATIKISSAGSVNFTTGTFSGSLSSTTGSIGGWAISSMAIYHDGATDNISSGMASADYPFYAGKKYANRATAPFRITSAGALTASSGAIGNWSINSGYLRSETGSNGDYVDLKATGPAHIKAISGASSNTYIQLTAEGNIPRIDLCRNESGSAVIRATLRDEYLQFRSSDNTDIVKLRGRKFLNVGILDIQAYATNFYVYGSSTYYADIKVGNIEFKYDDSGNFNAGIIATGENLGATDDYLHIISSKAEIMLSPGQESGNKNILPDGNCNLGSSSTKWDGLHVKHIYSTSSNEFMDLTQIDARIKQNLICYTNEGKNLGDSTHKFASVFQKYVRADEIRDIDGNQIAVLSGGKFDLYKPLVLFCSSSYPSNPAKGEMFWHNTVGRIMVYNGTQWLTVSSSA